MDTNQQQKMSDLEWYKEFKALLEREISRADNKRSSPIIALQIATFNEMVVKANHKIRELVK